MEKQERFTKKQRKKALTYLINLARNLDAKEKYYYTDYGDCHYFGMKNIESSFKDIDDYYKAILTKESFIGNYQYYEIRVYKEKNLSLKQYLYMTTPNLAELINERKNNTRSEQKLQLIMAVNFSYTTDNGTRTFYVRSNNVEIRPASDTNYVIIQLFESFLNKYKQEENILRNGSNYSFGSAEIVGIHFHNIKLKEAVHTSFLRNGYLTKKQH